MEGLCHGKEEDSPSEQTLPLFLPISTASNSIFHKPEDVTPMSRLFACQVGSVLAATSCTAARATLYYRNVTDVQIVCM